MTSIFSHSLCSLHSMNLPIEEIKCLWCSPGDFCKERFWQMERTNCLSLPSRGAWEAGGRGRVRKKPVRANEVLWRGRQELRLAAKLNLCQSSVWASIYVIDSTGCKDVQTKLFHSPGKALQLSSWFFGGVLWTHIFDSGHCDVIRYS